MTASKEEMLLILSEDSKLMGSGNSWDGNSVLIKVHGKDKVVCEWAMGAVHASSPVRSAMLWITDWKWFDRFILTLIAANSIILALEDHRVRDTPINRFAEQTEIVFTVLFITEMVLKMGAMGLFLHPNAYFRDCWNWLDALVVVTGVLSMVVSAGSLSFLRVFRVLRPLRSLSVLPRMRLLVNTVLLSIPRLMNVAGMAIFLLTVFGILGMNFWNGVMHRRCRLTPQPLRFVHSLWIPTECIGSCLKEGHPVWLSKTHSSFIEKEGVDWVYLDANVTNKLFDNFCGKECRKGIASLSSHSWWVWPVDSEQERLCGGRYQCTSTEDEDTALLRVLAAVPNTVCGNKYDADEEYGPSAYNPHLKDVSLSGDGDEALFSESFNFGFTHYDQLAGAALVVFQSCTLEGWVDIMYMLQDSHNDVFASLYFLVVIFIGSFFLLNVTLAVVWDAFEESEAKGEDAEETEDSDVKKTEKDSEDELLDQPPRLSQLSHRLSGHGGKADATQLNLHVTEKVWYDHVIVRLSVRIANSDVFQYMIMGCIILNVITLSLDGYPPPQALMPILAVMNIVFAVVFIFEMVLMHFAIGPKDYWTNKATTFDGIIVVSSLLEFLLDSGGSSSMLALRGFRLLRVFKLAKKWKSFRLLLKSIVATVMEMGNFVLLLSLIIFVFSLCGQAFFANTFLFDPETGRPVPTEDLNKVCISPIPTGTGYKYDSCVPRAHFDTFPWCVITIFQILSGENWNVVMYDGMRGVGWHAVFFFIFCVLIGNFLILNLFIAILMSNFDEQSSQHKAMEAEQQKEKIQEIVIQNKNLQSFLQVNAYGKALHDIHAKNAKQQNKASGCTEEVGDSGPEVTTPSACSKNYVTPVKTEAGEQSAEIPGILTCEAERPVSSVASPSGGVTPSGVGMLAEVIPESPAASVLDPSSPDKAGARSDVKLLADTHGSFGPGCSVKEICSRITSHKHFDNIILVCILLSSFCMALDNPLDSPESTIKQILYISNFIFTSIFFLEMMLKIKVMGFVVGQGTYLRNSWNVLDFVIVCISLAEFVDLAMADKGGGSGLSFLKTTRILRAFRPLRLISRNENLKLVVNTLFRSVPELCNLLVVGSFFFLLFGLLGMNMLKGTFYRCLDKSLEDFPYDFQHIAHGTTPVCIDNKTLLVSPRGTYEADTGKFIESSVCENPEAYSFQRLSADTPMCIQRCDGERNGLRAPKCFSAQNVALSSIDFQNSPVWGYKVLRCSDCSRQVCDSAEQLRPSTDWSETCRDRCSAPNFHPLFCRESCNDANGEACKVCVEECVAQCECDDFCEGFVHHGAQCVEQGGKWLPYLNQDFDSVGSSMRTLFEIATTEGWVDAMYAGVDSTSAMHEPIRDNHPLYGWGFVAFILVGSFFVLNLCVGVIIDNFNSMKDESGIFHTERQKQWINAQKTVLRRRVYFPITQLERLSPLRRRAALFISGSCFDNGIVLCICLNTISMACMQVFPPWDDVWMDFFIMLNLLFAAVFNLECLLKLWVLDLSYFQEMWNTFDFVCVVLTNVGVFIDLFFDSDLGAVASAVRVLRIARVFRLLRFAKGISQLFTAFFLSIPKLANVGAILMLLLFLYAVLGMNMFAKVRMSGAHDEFANFRTFYRSFMTLTRSMTGEAWNELMHSLSKDQFFFESVLEQHCVLDMRVTAEEYAELEGRGMFELDGPVQCGSVVSFAYFLSFTLLVTFVILNLFIAVIFEGFDDSRKAEVGDIVDTCIALWPSYDPGLTLVLHLRDALRFIDDTCNQMSRMSVIDPKNDHSVLKREERRCRTLKETPYHILESYGTFSLQYALSLRLQVFNSRDAIGSEASKLVNEAHEPQATFPAVVLSVIRRMITGNDPAWVQEIDNMQLKDAERQRALQTAMMRRLQVSLNLGPISVTNFEEHVAAGKIQLCLRDLFESRKEKHQKREKKKRRMLEKQQTEAKMLEMEDELVPMVSTTSISPTRKPVNGEVMPVDTSITSDSSNNTGDLPAKDNGPSSDDELVSVSEIQSVSDHGVNELEDVDELGDATENDDPELLT